MKLVGGPVAAVLGIACLFVSLVVAAPPPEAAAAPAATPAFRSGDGLQLVSASPQGDRTWHLVVTTSALSRPVRVNVLLPQGYASSTRRYPVLYLLHGTSGGADDWLQYGDAAAATAGYPLIVVMPDAGYDQDGGSWFTNWVDQATPLGTANWETFHVDQLVPWIDANLRTIADRGGRAIAGLSQGGFGAFTYAARHPDTFVSAGSFSGAPDIASNPVVQAGAAGIIEATAVGLDGVEPDAMFGDPVLDRINWQGHDPADLVGNLADTSLDLWTGNGLPGPLDTPGTTTVPDSLIEGAVHTSTLSFAQAADRAHVAYRLDDYGPGTHSWPYWRRDLVQYLPLAMAVLSAPPPAPAAISYRSVDLTWSQWGWTVANRRAVPQAFSGLIDASTSRFTFTGQAPATVTTPAGHPPGSRYRAVAIGGTVPAVVTAGPDGRIAVPVSPAPGHAAVIVQLTAA